MFYSAACNLAVYISVPSQRNSTGYLSLVSPFDWSSERKPDRLFVRPENLLFLFAVWKSLKPFKYFMIKC